MNSLKSKDTFLLPEIRCGYCVDAAMKAVWSVELDILEEFIRICGKYNLHYALCGGSLLGAVRHKGFIPWDDDIDISMMRDDYDKFLCVAQRELKAPLFLQTTLTDPERRIGYAQIRRSDTAAIDLDLVKNKPRYNFGICLDIFPVDTVSQRLWVRKIQRFLITQITRLHVYAYIHCYKSALIWMAHIVAKIVVFVVRPKNLYHLREYIYKCVKLRPGDRIGLLSWSFTRDWNFWPPKCFDKYVEVPFEYLRVSIPACAEELLDITYGNWREPLKGGSAHGGTYYDVKKSYKDVLVSQFGYRSEWVRNLS